MPSPLRVFLLICVVRVLNTFLIQSYFDPDEFWQTLEPAYCAVFRSDEGFDCPGFTWEWKRRAPKRYRNLLQRSFWGPVRTYLSVLPTHIFYACLRVSGIDSAWMVARGPMLVNAVTVAAPVDWAVWYCTQMMIPSTSIGSAIVSSWSLMASLSAWFNAYTLVRTYSNSQEAVLLMLSICLVAEDLLAEPPLSSSSSSSSSKGGYSHSRQGWRARLAFFLGGMSMSIRGTAVAAFIPMGVLLAWQKRNWVERMRYLFNVCALYGLIGVGVASLVDTWFFGFPTLPFLGNFHFNVILNHGTLYGSHPWYWYFLAGIPAVAGILLPLLLEDWVSMAKWSKGRRNLWIIVIVYITTMSMNAHKEFRFILPLLPIFCILVGERLQRHLGGRTSVILRTVGLATLILANLLAVSYLGMFHQSGPVTVNREILRLSEETVKPSSTVRIDYWTGGCHSTPLLSSLHSTSIRFEVRTLDCSPSCRANPDILCEDDKFHQNPLAFLGSVYTRTCTKNSDDGTTTNAVTKPEETCIWSDDDAISSLFVVTMSGYANNIVGHMNEMGLSEMGRFMHSICGVRFGDTVLGDDFHNTMHRRIRIASVLEICVEDVVLFSTASTSST